MQQMSKTGHFKQVCDSKALCVIKEVASSETGPEASDSDCSLYAIDSVNAVEKLPSFIIMVALAAVKIPFYVNTGSSTHFGWYHISEVVESAWKQSTVKSQTQAKSVWKHDLEGYWKV